MAKNFPAETPEAADKAWAEYVAEYGGELSNYDPEASFLDGFREGARWAAQLSLHAALDLVTGGGREY